MNETPFPKFLMSIPKSWEEIANDLNVQPLKIQLIFNVFKDRMVYEQKTSDDWEDAWRQYLFTRRL